LASSVAANVEGVSFRWKDYRIDGPEHWKTMTHHPHECIRRFLLHVLPKGFSPCFLTTLGPPDLACPIHPRNDAARG
jgi:hypothetical protein